MPNRLIRDSIHTSESVNQMTDFQFRLWINLITYVDDYGRGDARPAVIRGHCFPLRDRLANKDIEAALMALAGIGCVGLYTVDGKPYLYFPEWERYQNVRNQKSKYPGPEAADGNCKQLNTIDSKCPRNPIQSESNPDVYCAERSGDHSAPQPADAPAVFELSTNDGGSYHVTQAEVDKYAKLYPSVDVAQEYRNMIGWLESNPAKRKTLKGMPRFINTWLAREQDRGGRKVNAPVRPRTNEGEPPVIPKFKFYDE